MSVLNLGRRYERLLVLSAPLSLVSLVVLFVAVATTTQQERITARCYEEGATAFEANRADIDSSWKAIKPGKWELGGGLDYKLSLNKVIIYAHVGAGCYGTLRQEVERRQKQDPSAIISGLRQDAARIMSGPVVFRGIELPEKASIDVLGTKVKIELMTFVRLLQIILAPIMLLWLGSLYNTRYRESLLIAAAKSVADIFPHVVNVYPAVRYPQPRKRSYVQQYLPQLFNLIYALLRLSLLMIFVAPSTGAYIFSLVLLDSSEFRALFATLGSLVAFFTLAVALTEILPWHYTKTFPGPPLLPPKAI